MASTPFDPNAAPPPDAGIFGLPTDESEAALVFLPVPWEATTSYGGGTSMGPDAIRTASHQIDLYDLDVLRPYEAGLHMRETPAQVVAWNREAKSAAARIIATGGRIEDRPDLQADLDRVNELGEHVHAFVEAECRAILDRSQIVGVVGGDHSVPFGALRAIADREPDFGILHFDAHSDTRAAYEGFVHSHASIMYNVLERLPSVTKLVQVGIRDVCEEEVDYCRSQGERVAMFTDRDLQRARHRGRPWADTARAIVAALPAKVWVSFDIDGLDPRFCPNTGTPVPGGLDLSEANYLIGEIVRSGRTLIGFDLDEVAPDPSSPENEWNQNVGARLLYKLAAWTLASQGKAQLAPD